MSCVSLFKVKSSQFTGVKKAFVPCGHCYDCVQKAKFSWQFRLRAEWQGLVRRDETWHCAFVTLTYGTKKGGWSSDKRPIVHRRFYKNPQDFDKNNPIYCFNKHHVHKLINNLKVFLYTNYGITKENRIRYIYASEYGDWTHRSHYHGLLFYPLVNGLTDEVVYNFIKDFWEKRYGMVFPQSINGGNINKKGMIEKPFVVQNKDNCIENTISYVSKYICKDLEFGRVCQTKELLIKKNKLFKMYDCFHLTSKSLGACMLDGLNNSQLASLYFDGHSFAGDEKKRPLPVYLKNKIVFDNYYIYKKDSVTGEMKRLVRKKANEFFKNNYNQIFEKKSEFYRETFVKLMSREFYEEYLLNEEDVDKFIKLSVDTIQDVGLHTLSDWFVAYFGRPRDYRFMVSPSYAYLTRYDNTALYSCLYCSPLHDEGYARWLDDKCATLMTIIHTCGEKFRNKELQQKESYLHLFKECLNDFTC